MNLASTERRGETEPAVAERGVIAIWASRPLANFDAVAAFQAISEDGQGFILDGRSPEENADRFVYIGCGNDDRMLTGEGFSSGDGNPADALRRRLENRRLLNNAFGEPVPSLPFLSGAVGYFGYEAIRYFEPSVSDIPADPLGLPEVAFFLPDRFVAYNRLERTLFGVVLVSSICFDEANRGQALREAEHLVDIVVSGQSTDARYSTAGPDKSVKREYSADRVSADRLSKSRYAAMVRQARNEIERGELIQVVLSQRAIQRTNVSPLAVYEVLAALNPSPYMFMLNFGDFVVVGCSPELMVRLRGREVSMHPIAGTRPRGATPEADAALEAELLTSEKERAEHVMLVDLARNDLGRVSEPGSVNVDSFMATERYSHVMHLVSRVKGRLSEDADGLDALVAGFPLGTLTGAPRLRAVELIAELEQQGRGPYCGGVGWFDASGDVDTGTVIRCIVMKDGEAHTQGGGGIVFDSDPEREYLESVQKMAAQFEAIEIAEKRMAEVRLTSEEAAG